MERRTVAREPQKGREREGGSEGEVGERVGAAQTTNSTLISLGRFQNYEHSRRIAAGFCLHCIIRTSLKI